MLSGAKHLNACQREMLRLRLSMTESGGVSSPMNGAPTRRGGSSERRLDISHMKRVQYLKKRLL